MFSGSIFEPHRHFRPNFNGSTHRELGGYLIRTKIRIFNRIPNPNPISNKVNILIKENGFQQQDRIGSAHVRHCAAAAVRHQPSRVCLTGFDLKKFHFKPVQWVV